MKRLTIATRQSRLAMWQAEHVKARLEAAHPGLAVDLLPLTTTGDERLEVRLDKIGGKGLFVKELEVALAERRADIAVHSMKDVPADLPPGFRLCAAMTREDPRDAFVSGRYGSFGEMPAGARVGTSSLRRAAQVAARHPSLAIHTLRGNVLTRLEKLDRGDYDAIVLAAAGLKRLGLADRIRRHLDVEESLPAAGQGILGIECLEGRPEIDALMVPLADPVAEACARAERAVSRALGGSCTLPLGAFAEAHNGELRVRALVASADGRRIARADCRGPAADPEALGDRAASALKGAGAEEILRALQP